MYSDVFVFLDNVKYVKGEYQSRVKIRTDRGPHLLSIPIQAASGNNINEMKVDNSHDWYYKHKSTLESNYKKSPYFGKYWDFFDKLYSKRFDLLIDVCMPTIYFLMEQFGIKTKTVFSSELDTEGKGSNLILSICKNLGATRYLSGPSGKNYLDLNSFRDEGVDVEFQNFHHPVYRQVYEPFIPNLSAVDLLFNEGEKSVSILKNAKNF